MVIDHILAGFETVMLSICVRFFWLRVLDLFLQFETVFFANLKRTGNLEPCPGHYDGGKPSNGLLALLSWFQSVFFEQLWSKRHPCHEISCYPLLFRFASSRHISPTEHSTIESIHEST